MAGEEGCRAMAPALIMDGRENIYLPAGKLQTTFQILLSPVKCKMHVLIQKISPKYISTLSIVCHL